MNISVVLPIYNEDKIISATIREVLNRLPKYVQKYEILAVDDGSTDKTAQILSTLSRKHTSIRVITHSPNKGYGAALQSGIQKAKYSWIFFMDSDLQFDVHDIKSLIDVAERNDLIVGYRKDRADHARRIYMSHIYNTFVRFLFPLPVRDVDCAFKLMRKSTLLEIGTLSNSFFVSSELMIKAALSGARILELPVKHLPRPAGYSKVTPIQILKTVLDLGRIYLATLVTRILPMKSSYAPVLWSEHVE
ncbi:MAG: glycosyltransferase family 2 protein [Candidatus Roizmanbacteria bacterium]|nr:glycosyltransferase family 2 protein [Candidatus Roizmanbacteria bacterium]